MVPTAMRTGLGCFSINNVFSLFLFVLLNLGCFVFCNTNDSNQKKKQKLTSSSPSPHSPAHLIKDSHNKSKSSTWAYIKSVFTKINKIVQPDPAAKAIPVLTSARSSHRSLVQLDQPPHQDPVMELHHQQPADMMTMITTDNSSSFFSQRNNDIYPCTACGQIFHKTQLLEHHQTVNHALSELTAEDPGRNIVKIIFKSSWTTTYDDLRAPPRIHRIWKIHNSPKVLYRFEEYRELVKSKASAARSTGIRRPRDERCIADGNELLRFHCSTFMCQQLGQDGNSTLCSQPFCSVCGIIRYGFSAKLDGISTMSTSWRAHMSIPDEILEEFQFMNVKRAMLLCRVVAGRIGTDDGEELCEKSGEGGFDSVFGQAGSGALTSVDEEELLVFNPRAVLPCFVIVYTV